MKSVAIGIITYPIYPERVEYLEFALSTMRERMTVSRHSGVAFVSCESAPWGDTDAVQTLCEKYGVYFHLNPGDPSMGANQNNSMRLAFENYQADYLLSHIDDFHTLVSLDLSEHLDFMEANPEVDVLRFHWSERTGARPMFYERGDGYMQVDPASYRFYDDSPHLRRADFAERFGWHTTGTPADAGITERDTCERLRDASANIVATPEYRFGKGGGEVSACRPMRRTK